MDVKPVYSIDANGTQSWRVDGQLHREDGPAVIMADGTQKWCVNGQRHRIDGPAIDRADGTEEWFINGRNITQEVEQWMKLKEISWPWDDEAQVEFLLSWT